jgi:hypothetical protein
MLQQLWKKLSTTNPVRKSLRDASRRPALEALEDRCVPATYTWTGPSGGLWNNPANWSGGPPGTVPGAGSNVIYNSAGTSFDNLNIPSPGLNLLEVGTSAGTLTVSGLLTISATGELAQAGGVIRVTGGLRSYGAVECFGGTLVVSGSMRNYGFFEATGTNVDVFGSLVNFGTYNWHSGQLAGSGNFINVTTGVFTIEVPAGVDIVPAVTNYGTIDWQAGDIFLEGVLTNTSTGAFNITTANTMSGPSYLVNNDGGTITLDTGSGAFLTNIDVAFGPSNVNFGTIDVQDGSLVLGTAGSTVAFTNEGTIQYTGSNTGCVIAFNATFEQLPNTQNTSVMPQVTDTPGNALYFAQGGIVNSGFMIVNGLAAFTGPVSSNDNLVVETNGYVQIGGVVVVNGVLGDAGGVTMHPIAPAGASITGTVFINKGELETDAMTMFTNTINGNVINVGMLNVEANSNLVITGSLLQGGQGETTVYGLSWLSTLVVDQYIDIEGGFFYASENSATTAAHGLIIGPSATLQFVFGNATVNGNVYILGQLKTLFDSNGTFTGSVAFGSSSTAATISMDINSTVTFNGAVDFANASLSFGFISSTPAVYTPMLFNGALSGAPTVTLPTGDTWSLSATELQVTVP